MSGVSQRNQSMDILRILACLGVIIIHMSASVFAMNYAERGSFEGRACSVLGGMFTWSVPIFVMMTGFFFLNPEKELSLKKLYGKNILHLVLTLIFWTWFYAITLKGLYTGYYPFGGRDTNFWYIGMCIGLYISMPVLRRIAADDKLLAYSCWTWFFIRVYLYVGKYVEVPIVITDHVFTGYMGYCLWGYFLSRVQLNRKQSRMIYFAGFIFLVAMIVLPIVIDRKVRFAFEDATLCAFAIFLFAIKHPIHLSPRMGKIVEHLSSTTLGIYMVHTFVIIEIFSRMYRFFPNVFVLVPLSIVATFVLSYIIILIIKQIPILKKWIV